MASILTLLTCRPTFSPIWSHRSYLTEVTVNRLSRPHVERMAEQVTGGRRLPAAVMQQLLEKTDGVPLFVEELTMAVLESGVLKQANDQYELAKSFAPLAIPATLQDSLMARLDRLVTAKGLAQQASVIGREFSYELLQAVSQLDAMTLRRELRRLVEAELVYQRDLPPRATYLFKHALVVEAAYASLLKSTRQQYHQRIAQTLEAQFPTTVDTQPELVAHHYTEAACTGQAMVCWHQAGRRAIGQSAPVEGIAHLRKGLELLGTLPDTAERAEQELLLQRPVPDAVEEEACFHHALSIAHHQHAKSWELHAVTSLSRLRKSQGKRQEAYDLLAPLYGWFTEGFNTADLKEAKTLLDELS
jgi:predicted ATPase